MTFSIASDTFSVDGVEDISALAQFPFLWYCRWKGLILQKITFNVVFLHESFVEMAQEFFNAGFFPTREKNR